MQNLCFICFVSVRLFIFFSFKRFINESIGRQSSSGPIDLIKWNLCMACICYVLRTSGIVCYLWRDVCNQCHHHHIDHHPLSSTSATKNNDSKRYKEESASQKGQIKKTITFKTTLSHNKHSKKFFEVKCSLPNIQKKKPLN